jgi:small subunit ribosomal protein S20
MHPHGAGAARARGRAPAAHHSHFEVVFVASHASALKAHRQSVVRRERNRQYRTRLRRALKNMRQALNDGNADEAKASFSTMVSLIDKLVGKGIIHDNAAGRYKSRLTKQLTARSVSA